MNTVAVFIMSVAISHTASVRSGMLACNPNDKKQKPVIYAFDGKHLIKDNSTGPIVDPEQVGIDLARKLINQGADKILAKIFKEFRGK